MSRVAYNKKEITWVEEGGCFRCTSHKPDTTGYPVMRRDGRKISIPRWILMQRHTSLSASTDTRHTCDNRWCINPAHLLPGTRLDNVMDMVQRGRHARTRLCGERHPNHKLTWAKVAVIRKSGGTHRSLAARYGISRSAISAIKSGRAWNAKDNV